MNNMDISIKYFFTIKLITAKRKYARMSYFFSTCNIKVKQRIYPALNFPIVCALTLKGTGKRELGFMHV